MTNSRLSLSIKRSLALHDIIIELEIKPTDAMSKLPVIGSLCLRKDFWDDHGVNIASCQQEINGERCFDLQKTDFGERSTLFRRSFIIHG